MYNPFQLLTDAFHEEYRVNLSIERLDGCIMLTLSNQQGLVAKRLISPAQRNDPQRLQCLIQSVQFGIASQHGEGPRQLLAATRNAASTSRQAATSG